MTRKITRKEITKIEYEVLLNELAWQAYRKIKEKVMLEVMK